MSGAPTVPDNMAATKSRAERQLKQRPFPEQADARCRRRRRDHNAPAPRADGGKDAQVTDDAQVKDTQMETVKHTTESTALLASSSQATSQHSQQASIAASAPSPNPISPQVPDTTDIPIIDAAHAQAQQDGGHSLPAAKYTKPALERNKSKVETYRVQPRPEQTAVQKARSANDGYSVRLPPTRAQVKARYSADDRAAEIWAAADGAASNQDDSFKTLARNMTFDFVAPGPSYVRSELVAPTREYSHTAFIDTSQAVDITSSDLESVSDLSETPTSEHDSADGPYHNPAIDGSLTPDDDLSQSIELGQSTPVDEAAADDLSQSEDKDHAVVAALVKPSQQWLIQHKMDIQVRRNHAKQMSKPTPRGDMPQIARYETLKLNRNGRVDAVHEAPPEHAFSDNVHSLRPPKRTRSDQQAGVDGATLPEEERAPKRRCLKEWSHVKAIAIKKGATKMAKKAFKIALSSTRQFVRFLTGLGQQANGQEIMLATAQPIPRSILKKPRLPDMPRVPMPRPIVRRHPADIYWDKVHAAAGQKHQEHRMATAATEVDQALESSQGPPRARSPMAQELRIIAIRAGTPNHQDQELVHPPAPEDDALAATDDDPFPFIVHPKYIENHAAHSLQAFEARVAATSLKGVEILFAWHEESCDVDPEFQPTFKGFARAFELVQDPVLLRVHDRLHDKFLGWVLRNLGPLLDQGILTQADVDGVKDIIAELVSDEMEDVLDFQNEMDGVVFDNDVDESMTGMSEAGDVETTSSKASSPQPMEGIIIDRNTGPLPTGGRKIAKATGRRG
ncbi:unnamed protein product [Zymoseptoria tritici ST99CH_3D1]|nr:unnamed protein product [Zymoseptoria tritici ST99CH_3D1]